MTNQFLNEQEYANVMLLLLKNELVTGRLVDGQFKNETTDQNGLIINVKRPPRFIDKKDGTANLAAQDILTGSVNVAVTEYSKVHVSVGDIEYIASFNQLMQNETMKSAASTLANSVDSFLQSKVLGFNSWVAGASTGGVNATDPSKPLASPTQAFGAYTRLQNQGAPGTGLSATVAPIDGELLRGSLVGGFIQGTNLRALERVKIPLMSEIDWYATQQTPSLTTGSRIASGHTLVNGANQNVNYRDVKTTGTQTIHTDTYNGATDTVALGDVFTIANVYAWDWRANGGKGAKLDYLQQFTVAAAVTASGSAADLVISPPIIVQGTSDGISTDANTAFATVDSIPADNAAITFVGVASTTYRVRAAWQKRAIAMVTARLHMPFTGVASFAVDPETGIAIRYWRGSDINTGAHLHRWDMMYGASVMDPALGTRICGSTP